MIELNLKLCLNYTQKLTLNVEHWKLPQGPSFEKLVELFTDTEDDIRYGILSMHEYIWVHYCCLLAQTSAEQVFTMWFILVLLSLVLLVFFLLRVQWLKKDQWVTWDIHKTNLLIYKPYLCCWLLSMKYCILVYMYPAIVFLQVWQATEDWKTFSLVGVSLYDSNHYNSFG